MLRKLFPLSVILCGFILLSCTSTQPATTTAIVQATPSSVDGQWQGKGTSADGKDFVITLTIRDSSLSGIVYQFPGADGVPCTTITYDQIPLSEQSRIENGQLSAKLGDKVKISASFLTDGTASGRLTVHWLDRQPRCNGDYEVDWTATKQITQTAQPGGQPKPVNRYPFQTFVQILIFGLSNGAVLALNAIGVTLIYGTVRTLNLAHGDVFALTSVLVTSLVNAIGITRSWPPLQLAATLMLILLASSGAGALLSVGVEQLGFRPFRGHSRLAPMIATLGLSFILHQGALVWRTFQASWIPGEHRSVPSLPEVPTDGIPNLLPEINLIQALGLPLHIVVRFSDVFVLVMAFLFVAMTTWFLQRSRTGRALRALSQNQQAA